METAIQQLCVTLSKPHLDVFQYQEQYYVTSCPIDAVREIVHEYGMPALVTLLTKRRAMSLMAIQDILWLSVEPFQVERLINNQRLPGSCPRKIVFRDWDRAAAFIGATLDYKITHQVPGYHTATVTRVISDQMELLQLNCPDGDVTISRAITMAPDMDSYAIHVDYLNHQLPNYLVDRGLDYAKEVWYCCERGYYVAGENPRARTACPGPCTTCAAPLHSARRDLSLGQLFRMIRDDMGVYLPAWIDYWSTLEIGVHHLCLLPVRN